jgi:hypothetical protein
VLDEEKINISGNIESVLKEVSIKFDISINIDVFHFLFFISKTKNSGISKDNILLSLDFLKEKDESWFNYVLSNNLVEVFLFKTFKDQNKPWEGWFITSKGRKILKEILNKM